jgi:hypothetical protein
MDIHTLQGQGSVRYVAKGKDEPQELTRVFVIESPMMV